MAVSHPYKHLAVYLGVLGGALSFVTYALVQYEIMPPGLTGQQTWFIDMMDSKATKAYEAPMRTLPAGVVSTNMYVPPMERADADNVMSNLGHDYTVDEDFLASGEWSFETYCVPCHGPEGVGPGLVADNKIGKGKRFPIPPPALSGAGNVSSFRTDGYLYGTIRNGGAIMPAYGWAMSDAEMWGIVEYIRTLEGTAHTPEEPTEDESEEG